MPCSPSSSCSELAQFSWGHREVFCSKQVPIQRPGLVLSNFSKWLLKHYFRWNEKQNQKQCFDWIQGLYWTLPPHHHSYSLPLLPSANSIIFFTVLCLWTPTHIFLLFSPPFMFFLQFIPLSTCPSILLCPPSFHAQHPTSFSSCSSPLHSFSTLFPLDPLLSLHSFCCLTY